MYTRGHFIRKACSFMRKIYVLIMWQQCKAYRHTDTGQE